MIQTTSEDKMMDQPQQVIKYPEETGDFRTRLNRYDDELFYLIEQLQSNILHGRYEEDVVNDAISYLVILMRLIRPKIEGGGQKTQHLLEEFNEFKPWMDNIYIPKTVPEESDKILKLYDLIQRAFHHLNISNL
jgi:hypothetical protein